MLSAIVELGCSLAACLAHARKVDNNKIADAGSTVPLTLMDIKCDGFVDVCDEAWCVLYIK